MLAQKIKQLAERMRDPHATVRSVIGPLGTWQGEEGDTQCDLVPQDKDFQDGTLILSRTAGLHLPTDTDLLTVTDLERLFGKSHSVPPPPSDNPYSVAFYPPDSRALLGTTVFADLSAPPEQAATHVTGLILERDDARAEATGK